MVGLAQLVSPSVALLAKLVSIFLKNLEHFHPFGMQVQVSGQEGYHPVGLPTLLNPWFMIKTFLSRYTGMKKSSVQLDLAPHLVWTKTFTCLKAQMIKRLENARRLKYNIGQLYTIEKCENN